MKDFELEPTFHQSTMSTVEKIKSLKDRYNKLKYKSTSENFRELNENNGNNGNNEKNKNNEKNEKNGKINTLKEDSGNISKIKQNQNIQLNDYQKLNENTNLIELEDKKEGEFMDINNNDISDNKKVQGKLDEKKGNQKAIANIKMIKIHKINEVKMDTLPLESKDQIDVNKALQIKPVYKKEIIEIKKETKENKQSNSLSSSNEDYEEENESSSPITKTNINNNESSEIASNHQIIQKNEEEKSNEIKKPDKRQENEGDEEEKKENVMDKERKETDRDSLELMKRPCENSEENNIELEKFLDRLFHPNISLEEKKSIVMNPLPLDIGFICLTIKRYRASFGKRRNPKFELILSRSYNFILSAKKRSWNKGSNYMITFEQKNASVESDKYIGKLRSLSVDLISWELNLLYMTKEFLGKKTQEESKSKLRAEYGAFVYGTNLFGSNGPRKMNCYLPILSEDKGSYKKIIPKSVL